MSAIKPKLQKTIQKLPTTAGVYLFHSGKEIIYIGKAINIRSRVKNHFLQPSYRDNLFMDSVSRIGFEETNSEIEALVLEAQLIKKHQPKFNVVWRDDKNYFYVAVVKNKDKLPYIFITHQPFDYAQGKPTKKLSIKYIGPFVEGAALKKTLKYLRRVFPFYTSPTHPKQKCTWCHIDLCPGPRLFEARLASSSDEAANLRAEYKKNVKKLILILEGKRKTVLNALKKEMNAFSKAQAFEKAAVTRNQFTALEHVMSHTHILNNNSANQDGRLDLQNYDPLRKTEEMLKKIIGVKKVSRIECYDISNIQGKQATGSMVVFVNGQPNKSHYKKFRIRWGNESRPRQVVGRGSSIPKESGPNDIAMLKEVFKRRFNHPEWQYPDVMLIDGGKAQINIAINTKKQDTITKQIKVISIAKGRRELFIEGKEQPIPLKNLPQEVYNLIVHLDDEAHRFALTYHRKLRKKKLLK